MSGMDMRFDIKTAHCPAGGFSKNLKAIYILVVGSRFYIGKTGTSNRTGVSAPYQRFATHLHKRGRTQSALWDLFEPMSDLNESDIFFSYAYVPQTLRPQRIERCMVFDAREKFGEDVVLNRTPVGDRPDMSNDEEQFAREFLEAIFKTLSTNDST